MIAVNQMVAHSSDQRPGDIIMLSAKIPRKPLDRFSYGRVASSRCMGFFTREENPGRFQNLPSAQPVWTPQQSTPGNQVYVSLKEVL